MLAGIAERGRNVDAAGIVVSSRDVANSHDVHFGLGKELGGMRTHVAKSLNRDADSDRLAPQSAEHFHREDADAAAGRFLTPRHAKMLDRFASDHRRTEPV